MRSLVKSGLVWCVLASAIAVGCSSSSSDDSSGGGSSSGGAAGQSSGGTSSGGTSSAGMPGKAGASAGGAPNGGSTSTEAGASSGGELTSAGASGDSAGAGGAAEPPSCNSLVVTAAEIAVTHDASTAAPTLTQGLIHPGNYELTTETLYDGGTGTAMVRSNAVISVTGSSATIDSVEANGVHTTALIEMGSPATAAPVSLKITCTNSTAYAPYVGVDLKAAVSYGATATTFSLYAGVLRTLTVFTLKP